MFRVLTALLCICAVARAQENTPVDSVKVLNEVVVKAYATDRPLTVVPASIGVVQASELARFSNASILPAVNLIPGVRMEERSPGSYRFAIRGSSLRSPFGVRNVKVYWNGLPLTDGGGNTYLNILDLSAIGSAEIIKGPGGSLYGAGTGGVLLFESPRAHVNKIEVSGMAGSFGLQRYAVAAQTGSEKLNARVLYAHQQAEGYRQQTAMNRDAVNAEFAFSVSKTSTLSATVLYSDLTYETPGGLTKAQYDDDPAQARPATATLPGAVEARAAVYNKTLYGALAFENTMGTHWSTRMGLYTSHTQFDNPTIRNYEQRKEDNLGGRFDTQYKFGSENLHGKITIGIEFQHFKSPVTVHNNDQGAVGSTLLSDDILGSNLLLSFAQAEFDLPEDFLLTIGGSGNFIRYDFESRITSPSVFQNSDFNPVFSPRVALLKKITPAISLHGSISNGFSPPTLAEVRPSTNNINTGLKPERGTNYELGFKGGLGNVGFEITGYNFQLKETIVIQRTPDGADYFVNAGNTSQRGLEASLSWNLISNARSYLNHLKIQGTYSLNYYHFGNYVQDGKDYSGNRLTGVAPDVVGLLIDVKTRSGLYMNVTGNYVDHIPLNDGNTEYASDYFLLGSRLGYTTTFLKRLPCELFAGADNLLDQEYSLGNDLNAAGGRYYNAAATRNYYAGLKLTFAASKK